MKSIAIVGGGISGLAAAWFILKEVPKAEVTLFESDSRLGGKIRSDREQGFLYEHGPNGFMDSRQEMVDFCNELELQSEMIKSNDSAANRFIIQKGKLKALPKKPPQIFTSGFLPVTARLRLMTEPFRGKCKVEDETLYEFCKRRLGKHVAETLVDPFTSGVFGADCRQLSTRSAFKALWDMEQNEGSIFQGMKKKMKESKGKKRKQGKLSSFKDGMETLIQKLAEKLKGKIKIELNSKISSLTQNEDHYELQIEGKESRSFDLAVLASPASATGNILKAMDKPLGEEISNIPYSAITVVPQGYKHEPPAVLNAFGYLAPSSEPNRIMGNLFDASVFPNRAPENAFMIRTMLGGGRNPEIINFSDDEVYKLILEENRQTLGIDFEANFKKIIRWQEAIPVYEMGHWKLIEKIEHFTADKGIFVTGNAFYGVSMNDCVTSAIRTANEIKDYLKEKK